MVACVVAWVAWVVAPCILGATQAPVYRVTVEGDTHYPGLYATSGQGYTRLGGRSSVGYYIYLYSVELAEGRAWVLGYSSSTDPGEARAWYRTSGALEEGAWEDVYDYSSPSHAGGNSTQARKITVERVPGVEAGLEELEGGLGVVGSGGVVCQRRGKDARGRPEWTYIDKSSPSFCDGEQTCTNQLDESVCPLPGSDIPRPESVVVSGADVASNGLYFLVQDLGQVLDLDNRFSYYRKQNNQSFIYKHPSKTQLIIGVGGSLVEAVAAYRSDGNTTELANMTWSDASAGGFLGKDDGARVDSVRATPVPEHINRTVLEEEATWKEELVTERGDVLCYKKGSSPLEKLLILAADKKSKCGGPAQCQHGTDQAGCNQLADKAFWPSVYVVVAVLAIGFTICLAKLAIKWWAGEPTMAVEEEGYPADAKTAVDEAVDECIMALVAEKDEKAEKPEAEAEKPEEDESEAEPATKNPEPVQPEPLELDYDVIHGSPDGLHQLASVGLTLLETPEQRHTLAARVEEEELARHGGSREAMLRCFRAKVGSNAAAEMLLGYARPPNCLKMAKYFCIDVPINSLMTLHRAVSTIAKGVWPVLRVAHFLFDYSRDYAVAAYLFVDSWQFFQSDIIRGLAVFYLLSITASSIYMVFLIQMQNNNGIMNIEEVKNLYKRRGLRVCLFFLSFSVPVCIIIKTVQLAAIRVELVAQWRVDKTTSSPSALWCKVRKLEEEAAKVSAAFTQLKVAEINLEGVPQLFTYICLFLIPQLYPASGLGPEFETVPELGSITWLLLVGGPMATVVTNISGMIAYVNHGKSGQLNMKSSFVLGLSFVCQLAAKMLVMVPMVLSGLPDRSLEPVNCLLLLTLPTILHLAVLLLTMPTRVTQVVDKMNHLVANLWFTVSPRLAEEVDQLNKSREQTLMHLLVGANLAGSAITTALLMDGAPLLTGYAPLKELDLTASQEFLLVFAAPAALCHALNCMFMLTYYSCTHTFREVGSEREERCTLGCCCGRCSLGRLGRLFHQGEAIRVTFHQNVDLEAEVDRLRQLLKNSSEETQHSNLRTQKLETEVDSLQQLLNSSSMETQDAGPAGSSE